MGHPYEVHKLGEKCWRIEEDGVRCFLFEGADRALLVDTGFGSGSVKEIVDGLTDLPVMLLTTHADPDHIGCHGEFPEAWMHPAEFDRYRQGKGGNRPVRPLWEGDILEFAPWRFEVILIPGHTPGSIALLDETRRVLIGGDSVQTGAIYMFGPGRNLPAYIESMKKLERDRGRFDTVYPSHGPFPVQSDLLPVLIDAAGKLLAGELSGKQPPAPDMPCEHYSVNGVNFLYKQE